MQLTGTDKQIDFATKIVDTVSEKLEEYQGKIAVAEKGPRKNALKGATEVVVSYSGAFTAIEAILAGDVEKAESTLMALPEGSQAHAFEIVNKLVSSPDQKDVDAGKLINDAKGIFYNLTQNWSY